MLWNKKEEKSALPDLPPLEMPFKQELDQIQQREEHHEEESTETHALPSFPDSPNAKGFSQIAIKDAVSDESNEKEESVGNIPQNYKTVEMQEAPEVNHPSIIASKPVPYHEQTTYQVNSNQNEGPIPQPPIKKSQLVQNQSVEAPMPRMPSLNQKLKHADAFAPLPAHFSRPPTPEKHSHVFVKIDKFFSAKKALDETKDQLNQIEDLLKKIRELKLREEQELANWESELLSAKARIREVTQNIFEKVE
ncbi:MAG: hypothetical protein Q8Q31_00820 [Nanoarchaeota archaeon]|nr:hypothetical protein [Nanoarchaeota archaeon]